VVITKEFSDKVHRLAKRYIQDDLYEDTAQEVLIKLWRNAEFAVEGMIVMMLRYQYLRLKNDEFEDIDDHLHLEAEEPFKEMGFETLFKLATSKELTGRERTFFKFIRDYDVQVYKAKIFAGINGECYNRMIEKCKIIVDRDSESV
jgi:hypothetical protein